jgi:hypothetical protein
MQTCDLTTLIAVLGSTFTILITFIGLFLWIRSEANRDRREIHKNQREDRKEILNFIELTNKISKLK